MPRFFGQQIDNFLDIEVMIVAIEPTHIVVSAGVPNADWATLCDLFWRLRMQDDRLLPIRLDRTSDPRAAPILKIDFAPGINVDPQTHQGIFVCRCKTLVARHPVLLQPMLRLRLWQTPWKAKQATVEIVRV